MLVLSRKLDEEIVIAGNIRVKVLEIRGNTIRLGIDAPDHVPVLRRELQVRKKQFLPDAPAWRDWTHQEGVN